MSTSEPRKAEESRTTGETQISIELCIDGTGTYSVDTGIPFFDHMLDLLAKHALWDLQLKATGDLEVDYHHTVEDVGLVLGSVLDQALGDRKGITRYGSILLPMDEALSRVAVDLGGRPCLVYSMDMKRRMIRDFDTGIIEHFFRSFSEKARMNLHIAQLYGDDIHHAYESVFKGVARALYTACAIDPRAGNAVPSSKGVV